MNYKKFRETRNVSIILTTHVEMTWVGKSIMRYKELGYKYTGLRDRFLCAVDDLPRTSKARVIVQCPACNERRSVMYSSVAIPQHTLCQGCSNTWDLTGMRFGRLSAIRLDCAYKKAGSRWICQCDCGNTRLVLGMNLLNGSTVSCGCYIIELMKSRCGENSPNWNPRISNEERTAQRNHLQNTKWRELVYKRDNWTCQVCGMHGGKLEVHHLYSYSDYPEYQLDVDNGVTICKREHKKFHSWMGGNKVPCVPADFDRWLYETSCTQD